MEKEKINECCKKFAETFDKHTTVNTAICPVCDGVVRPRWNFNDK